MVTAIKDLRDMAEATVAAFHAQGIKDVEQLTNALATPAARKQWAESLGMTPQMVLTMANRADLSRINGIGGAFSDLLEAAGVDTVKELAHRRADNLHAKMVEVNAEKKLASRTPTIENITDWVEQAKALGGVITY